MAVSQTVFTLCDYDLAATLTSGQAFRWRHHEGAWIGIISGRWVRLRLENNQLLVQTHDAVTDWQWLIHYLQIEVDLPAVLASFPDDSAMQSAIVACKGLRLLRQDAWECLASFILSSTKQIVQIQQIISLLCERYGETIFVPPGYEPLRTFPSAQKMATLSEQDLRDCKMGFRAPYLLAAAQRIAGGKLDLERVGTLPLAAARAELISLPGVGPKIADCVLLFAYGFPGAFPVDVWVMKALRQLYFPTRQPGKARLTRFIETYFGAHPGYAQQYLFHYMRTKPEKPARHRTGSLLKRKRKKRNLVK